MCELMGLSFARPLSAAFSMRAFGGRDCENPDGWGLAWYPDRSIAVVKEPVSWRSSQHIGFLESYQGLLSAIYLAHVRHKTVGSFPTHSDTHPFVRELDGREYCFAHNGTLLDFASLPLGRFKPLGATDSEHAFCHLLNLIAERATRLAGEADWRWLHERLLELNRRGKINCLFSDGQRLFGYFDTAGHKGLYLRRIYVGDHEVRSFSDEEVQVELGGTSTNQGYAIASHPLSDVGWHRFHEGELLVLEKGVIRFSSHRAATQPMGFSITPDPAEATLPR
jgi:predicted glutamine amidotransferase